MPENAQINIASEINLNPIVNHHIIKNGFNPLNKTPVNNAPCFGFAEIISFFVNMFLIYIAANTKSVIAPKIDMIVLNSGNISNDNTPIPNKMINGNSTIAWPVAILIPAFVPSLNPYDTFAAKSGPGAITPDAEIIITNNVNSINCSIFSNFMIF